MNRQDAALVPFGQMSEVGWRFWLTVVGARSRAALATVRFERRSKWLPGNETRIVPASAGQRRRGGKTVHHARALPAELPADDFSGRHLTLD